ncbi:MAG TPA: nucleotide sugar dehydrogenase [Planctomycetes bacterium]|nr:nucleotide sugar dehydrogenase [Planctomycetota bacterium]
MRKIAVIGLGYVGLPVAVSFARRFPGTVGFDVDADKVSRLSRGEDPTGAVENEEVRAAELLWTADEADLRDANFYVVAVPTPIDAHRRPDLGALESAARTVGRSLSKGDIVVLESTVYPGVCEEVLAPILEQASGLTFGQDFAIGYSPERINPGDTEHTFTTIRKIVAGSDAQSLDAIAEVYGAVVDAGLHRAPSLRVAEAAKVIENVQRDLNIALVNELAMLFDRMGIDTRDVLEAAGTKWNFHPYRPGLVGGHCIGVDPYYLTTKAESIGFHPQVILAGRRINDGMGSFVAARTVKLLIERGRGVKGTRVGVLGVTFKPDVPDLRNSRVPDIVRELQEFGVEVLVHDPTVSPEDVRAEYGIEPVTQEQLTGLDALILAVPHAGLADVAVELVRGGVDTIVDVLWGLDPASLPEGVRYWRL